MKDYEVIVAGSGPAGIAAAVKAGREGAKVLLIEQSGTVGGMSTSGLMSHWTGSADSVIYREILNRHFDLCGRDNETLNYRPIYIDPEILKIVYFEMLEEAGVDVLLYTFVDGVYMDGDKVVGVSIVNKSGRERVNCKVAIDATGDGDLAAKAGVPFVLGREEDGKMQPATLMFKVGGVDYSRAVFPPSFETEIETEKGELQKLGKSILPHPSGHVLLYHSTLPGIVTVNMTNCTGIDGTKAEDLTRAEITCRKQMLAIRDFLREYAPGYENCYIISSASFIGVRETRHFKGLYTITRDDIYEAREFDDFIVRSAYFNFDVHNIDGAGLDKTGVQHKFKQKNGYQIPYGCLVPEKINGILLSGRNISGTHMAHSSFRAMPICVAIGEGAGAAAAIAVKSNREVRDISAKEIQALI